MSERAPEVLSVVFTLCDMLERWLKAGRPVPAYNRCAPACSWRERQNERLETLIMDTGQVKWFRFSPFKFLTSVSGAPFIRIRVFIKSRKYKGR